MLIGVHVSEKTKAKGGGEGSMHECVSVCVECVCVCGGGMCVSLMLVF